MKILLAVLWTLLILALCTVPGESLPDVDVFNADKLGHFALFAVFGWLWTWAAPDALRRVVPYILIAGLLFAGGTELYQGLLPFGRQPSVADAAANTVGLLLGVWLYTRYRTYRAGKVYRAGSG